MRALSSLLLAGAVGLGGLFLAPATADAHGGWRGRDHYRYVPPPPPPLPRYGYGYGYGPRAYYAPPPVYYRPPPPVYFHPAPPAFYGPPRSYGIPPGPGVGLWIR
jgi:hypothetical protein